MYYWEDLSAAEIGVVMEMPEGTVRGRIKRAKGALAKELGRLELTAEELTSSIENMDEWLRGVRAQL
jgi:RNA polymerase sigma-70 factor (ECF subfamily)